MKQVICLKLLLLSLNLYPQNSSINYIESCDSVFWNDTWFYNDTVASFLFLNTVNGIQQAQQEELTYDFTLNSDALFISDTVIQLTDALYGQSGSAWHMNQLDISSSFYFNISLFLGCNNSGADGIAFSLQQVSTAVGSAGGGMGYAGISPALTVEFDTYSNGQHSDPSYDHIGINANGDNDHSSANNLSGPLSFPNFMNIEDCNWHDFIISWDANSQIFSVEYEGDQLISYQGDIVNDIFGGNANVFWGFTGSTGALNNLQQVSMNNLVVTQYDSTAIGVITIHNSFENNINITNCDSIIYNGQSFYETGQYNFNYTNVFGCDSTINLNLTINKSSFTSQVLNFCDSYEWNNQTYTNSGTYSFATQNIYGCDSISEINLNIYESYINEIDTSSCNSFTFRNQEFSTSGVYTFNDYSVNGCDSLNILNLNILEKPYVDIIINNIPCQDDSITPFEVLFKNKGVKPFNFKLFKEDSLINTYNSYNDVDTFIFNKSGLFSIRELQDSMCINENFQDFELARNLNPNADFEFLPDSKVWKGTEVLLRNTSRNYETFIWVLNELALLDSINQNPLIIFNDTGSYFINLNIIDNNGCKDSIMQKIIVLPEFQIWIPTAFTPDNDGLNDIFKPTIEGVKDPKLFIFNRWGETIYSSNKNIYWDGKYLDKDCQSGVYLYLLTFKDYFNKSFKEMGEVHLVR